MLQKPNFNSLLITYAATVRQWIWFTKKGKRKKERDGEKMNYKSHLHLTLSFKIPSTSVEKVDSLITQFHLEGLTFPRVF